MAIPILGSQPLTTSGAASTLSMTAPGRSEGVDSHQKVWNAIDAIAWNATLSPSGLAKAAGLDATAFNPSKRVGAGGRQRWPSVETIQKILDATGATWFEFARLVGTGSPKPPQSE